VHVIPILLFCVTGSPLVVDYICDLICRLKATCSSSRNALGISLNPTTATHMDRTLHSCASTRTARIAGSSARFV
jgi:hypothetical protein